MTGISPDVVHLSGGNLVLVIIVFLIALGALAMAYMFRQEVLAAGEGTDNMKNIAHAVQEGANAYLQRQFRTLAKPPSSGPQYGTTRQEFATWDQYVAADCLGGLKACADAAGLILSVPWWKLTRLGHAEAWSRM